ncbi:MAG: AraC family transcriptional regulator [Anaerocolumna sp.]
MNTDLFNTHPWFYIEYIKHTSDQDMPNYHHHNGYELYFLEEGYQNILINDTILDVAPYDVVLHKPNIMHRSLKRQGCARTCIYFSERFLRFYYTDKAIDTLLACFHKELISLNKEIFPKIKKLMLLLERDNVTAAENRIFIYLADILNILNDYKDKSRSEPIPSAFTNLMPILTYINQNYGSINTIDEISSHFFMSKFHLCHIFKDAIGLTIIQYLTKIRIQNACTMLLNTNLSISDIGALCGFNSTMYFCKVFKQSISLTPGDFRKQII